MTYIPNQLRYEVIQNLNNSLTLIKFSTDGRILNHQQRSRMVATLARQFMKADSNMTLSQAMKDAWLMIKYDESSFMFLEYRKVCGKVVKKVIMSGPISNYYKSSGKSSRKLKPSQQLYIDSGAYILGKHSVRSFYTNSIISKF